MFAIRGLATNSSLPALYPPIVRWYCWEKETEQQSKPENKLPRLYMVEENQLICPANLSAQPGGVEQVQPYASVDGGKTFETGCCWREVQTRL